MDSTLLGQIVKAVLSVDDIHAHNLLLNINALNKQQPVRAARTNQLLGRLIESLNTPPEPPKLKTLEESYEAFSPELKAKLMLENGHLYFTVQGAALKSKDWQARLKTGGHELSKWAKDVLFKLDYDKNHRLEAGKTYKLGLVFGKEIAEDFKRSTSALQDLGCHKFGPQANEGLKGEFELLIREKFSNAELEAMGIWYIAVLHKPIIDSDGRPCVLCSNRHDGSYVRAHFDNPDDQWDGRGAFACLAS